MKRKKDFNNPTEKYEKATFAGGCFWCIQPAFVVMPGVIQVTAGYAGGKEKNPGYEEVASGATGHREAVQIVYNHSVINYKDLLDFFWKNIDPTDDGGQFVDRGKQYASAIFYHSEEQRKLAVDSKNKLEKSRKFDRPIVTEIVPYTSFYLAEGYHQDYYNKNPLKYKLYRIFIKRINFKK